jgi:uncharacterized OB-fold protein
MTSLPFDDADGPYWEAARDGELHVQQCSGCGHNQLYGRLYCTECRSDELSWVRTDPVGVLYSYTVVYRAPNARFRDRVPYVVALVDLAAGPRIMGNLVGIEPEQAEIGMLVNITFDTAGEIPVAVFSAGSDDK